MKYKAGYWLFKDDHVKIVRFHPGSGTKCFCSAIVQASFKSATNYSTSVCLHKLNGSVVGARCKCKAGAGGCCKHIAALLYCILEFSSNTFLMTKHVLISHSNGMLLRNLKGSPVLFSDILFVHHTFGKRKAEEEEIRMDKCKKYRTCPTSLQKVTKEEIRTLCTGLESNRTSSTFARVIRGNDCNPVSDNSKIGSSSAGMIVQDVEPQ